MSKNLTMHYACLHPSVCQCYRNAQTVSLLSEITYYYIKTRATPTAKEKVIKWRTFPWSRNFFVLVNVSVLIITTRSHSQFHDLINRVAYVWSQYIKCRPYHNIIQIFRVNSMACDGSHFIQSSTAKQRRTPNCVNKTKFVNASD